MFWRVIFGVGILVFATAAQGQAWPVVEHCDTCSFAQHAEKARAHTDGTVHPVRVYSLDLEWDTLHAFDDYTESEPGFSTTFSIPVAVPADIAAEWTLMLDYAKARREVRIQGVDLSDRSLIEQMGTLQRDLSLAGHIEDRLENDLAQHLLGSLTPFANELARLFFGAPDSVRTTIVTVHFPDGKRQYSVRWGIDETIRPVVAEIKSVPNTAEDIDGHVIPGTPEAFKQAIEQGGFSITGPLRDVEQLVKRFSGRGGSRGVSVRPLSGTASNGVFEVVRDADAPSTVDD